MGLLASALIDENIFTFITTSYTVNHDRVYLLRVSHPH